MVRFPAKNNTIFSKHLTLNKLNIDALFISWEAMLFTRVICKCS